jgi:hypothetical protein
MMKLTLGLVYMHAVFMLFGKHASDGVCICPDHKTWMHNVTHHEFCGKELSGKDCKEDAIYNCTKGIQWLSTGNYVKKRLHINIAHRGSKITVCIVKIVVNPIKYDA